MPEIIIGRAGAGKSSACLADITERMNGDPLNGGSLFLLLPEHATFAAEKKLAELSGRNGFIRARVLGFRRFAHAVLSETGGANLPRVSDVGRQLILRKILTQHGESLTAFARAAKRRGFLSTLSDTVSELKSWKVDKKILRQKAASSDELSLKGKLNDLSLILEEFEAAMAGRVNDAEDMMDELVERMSRSKLVREGEFWIDGFVFFNPQEIAVVEELVRYARDVHITLDLDVHERHPDNLRETGIFSRQHETRKIFARLVKAAGQDLKIRRLDSAPRFRNQELATLEQNLFAFPGAEVKRLRLPKENLGGVKIIETANRRSEAQTVAAEIVGLCREEGCRFRDIGVVIRDDSYRAALQNAFDEANVPAFFDDKRSGRHHPLAELIDSSFEVVRSFGYEAVFRALRTGFFPLERGQIDLLENYVLEFGIRGKRNWLAQTPWRWRRWSQIGDRGANETEEIRLASIERYRQTVAEYLRPFAEALAAAKNVRQTTTALYDFLLRLEVPQILGEWVERAEQQGRLDAAAMHRQVWDGVVALFDQLVDMSGDEAIPTAEYREILSGGLEALSVTLIPPGLDCVTVGAFDQNSLDNIRFLFVMGANDGIMPRRVREKGIFTDADRLHLGEMGVKLPAGSVETALTEKFLLYRAFTKPREGLFVSYALADSAGEGMLPATAVGKIRRLLPTAEFVCVPLEGSVAEGDDLSPTNKLKLVNAATATAHLANALRRRRDAGEWAAFWQDVYNAAKDDDSIAERREAAFAGLFAKSPAEVLDKRIAAELFAKNKRLKGSVTRFESFRACPFAHFARYGLNLAERRERRFAPLDLGVLLHEVLREFGARLAAQNRRWGDVTADEAAQIVEEIIKSIAPNLQNELLLSTAQYRSRLERIKRLTEKSVNRLINLDRASRFHPQLYEADFAAAGLSFTLKDGTRLELTGKIDRVDLHEEGKYFLVFDYKSGKISLELTKVFYGLQMQLLTYLAAAKFLADAATGKETIPAGMLYFFLRYPVITAGGRISAEQVEAERDKELRMNGWTLDDPALIADIDSTGKYLGIKISKKDGGINKNQRGRVKSAEELSLLVAYVEHILRDTGEKIMAGDVAAAPAKLGGNAPCTYCLYNVVCGFDALIDGYEFRELKEISREEMMDEMRRVTGIGMDRGATAGDNDA